MTNKFVRVVHVKNKFERLKFLDNLIAYKPKHNSAFFTLTINKGVS